MENMKNKDYLPTVSIDFDGVIHSYTSGWQGVDVIPDPPVEIKETKRKRQGVTSIEWLTELVNSNAIKVVIFSTRNFQDGGISAMKKYLIDNGIPKDVLDKISFPTVKVPAILHIDDRAVQFTGNFFNVNDIIGFEPWKMKK